MNSESNKISYNPKRVSRVYLDELIILGEKFKINDQTYHHLRNVLRLRNGHFVKIFNEKSGEFLAKIVDFSEKKSGVIEIIEKLREPFKTNGPRLLFAPVKNLLTQIIQKATELGASGIRPIITQNTILRKIEKEKLEQIAEDSACQCERLDVPEIMEEMTLNEILAENSLILLCDENGNGEFLGDFLAKSKIPAKDLSIMIGPEGGFSEAEFRFLESCKNVHKVTLGPRILRSETAIVTALALVQALVGDLNCKTISKRAVK